MTSHCPDESCPGVLEDEECSHCGKDYEYKHVGWIFTDDDTNEVVGMAAPEDYKNADAAVQDFGNEYADDFSIYYQTSDGERHSCEAESSPEDFD